MISILTRKHPAHVTNGGLEKRDSIWCLVEVNSGNVVQNRVDDIWELHYTSGAESINSTCTPAISANRQSVYPEFGAE
jgi:hypothetical protein